MKGLIIIFICFLGFKSHSQTVENIKDGASVAQEKRQVYEKWGDWKPDPWEVAGIPTNISYYTVWLFSSENRRYRRGKDIRPYKTNGMGFLSAVSTHEVQSTAEEIKDETEQADKDNQQEFLHITHATTKADVLYNLYYKLQFKIFYDIATLSAFEQHYFKDSKTKLRSSNLQTFYDKFGILKDKLESSFDADMPRGKRYLIYHKIMLDLRRLVRQMDSVNSYQIKLIEAKAKIKKELVHKEFDSNLSDRKLFINIISDNPEFY